MRIRVVAPSLLFVILLFASTLLAGATTTPTLLAQSATNDEFVPFSSDDGVFQLELPATWEVRYGEWIVDNEDFGTLIQASVDLSLLYDDPTISGMVVGITQNPVESMAQILLLEWHDALEDECTFEGLTEFELTVQIDGEPVEIPARLEHYAKCGEEQSAVAVIEAINVDYGFYIVFQLNAAAAETNLAEVAYQSMELTTDDGLLIAPAMEDTGGADVEGADVEPTGEADTSGKADMRSDTDTRSQTDVSADADSTIESPPQEDDTEADDTEADDTEEDSTLKGETQSADERSSTERNTPLTAVTDGEPAESTAEEESKLEKARSLAIKGKVDEAIAAFEEAMADDPSIDLDPMDATVTAMVEAGEALYFEDKTWQALQLYSSAIDLDTNLPDAYVGRAAVYRWFDEYDKALADLSRAIELEADDYNYAVAHAERGYIYYQREDNEQAIADLTKAITKQKKAIEEATQAKNSAGEDSAGEDSADDDSTGEDSAQISLKEVAWYYELRGYAYREQGAYADAVADFTVAIDLDETDYEYKWAYINRAAGYRDLGELERALADTTKTIELDPDYIWAYELRGRIHSDLGEHEKSIADLTEAIEFGQDDYDYSIAYGYRGYGYYQTEEYFDAVTDLTVAIELFPEYTWAYETRGDAHAENRQYDKAIADYTDALGLESQGYDYSSIYASRGIAYYELAADASKYYTQAIDDLTEAIALDPGFTWAYEWRGYTHADMENYEEAIEDFTAAIEIDQSGYGYQWAYSNRAQSYFILEEYELALPDLSKAIALDDEYVWAYETRGDIYSILGRYEEAISDFRKVTELDPRSAASWNTLCWYSALFGYADTVVDDACESAVTLADEADRAYYRDSRGVARALTGDGDGALEDFHAFVEEYGGQVLRDEWIERLEAGEEPESIFDDEMIQALLGESLPMLSADETDGNGNGGGESDSTGVDLLRFTLKPSEPLVATPPLGSLLAYSKDGKFGQDDPAAPLFMAVPAFSEIPIDDPSDFALQRLMLTANATIDRVESHTPITIGGLDGFETIASGDATSAEVELIIYQVVLFQGDGYITLKGLVGKDLAETYLGAFQTISRSLEVQ